MHIGLLLYLETNVEMGTSDTRQQNIIVITTIFTGTTVQTDQLDSPRTEEILESMRRNLAYPHVAKVYIVGNSIELYDRMLDKLDSSEKLRFHNVWRIPTYKDLFELATRLRGEEKAVVIMNSDDYLVEGFDKVNTTFMAENRILYALTRSGGQEKHCNMSNYCDRPYIGSNDAFLFVPNFEIPFDVLDLMDISLDVWGAENVLIAILKQRLYFKVLNPCRILRLNHYHCPTNKPVRRKRINGLSTGKWAGLNGVAPYSGLY